MGLSPSVKNIFKQKIFVSYVQITTTVIYPRVENCHAESAKEERIKKRKKNINSLSLDKNE